MLLFIMFIIYTMIFMIISIIGLIELVTHSPVAQCRSVHPGGGPGAMHCQPGQPGLTPPYHQPQLEWSSQTHPGPHCHSSSAVSHRVHQNEWEKPIEDDVQYPARSAVVALHACKF